MKYRIKATEEQNQRAAEWLEQPLPEDNAAFEETKRELDAIAARIANDANREAAE